MGCIQERHRTMTVMEKERDDLKALINMVDFKAWAYAQEGERLKEPLEFISLSLFRKYSYSL